MAYTQDTRIGELKAGGDPKLVLTRFAGTEAVSEPFAFYVEAFREIGPDDPKVDVDLDKLLGTDITVSIRVSGSGDSTKKRHFVGLVTDAKRNDDDGEGTRYTFVMRSWLHLLTKRINTRIFKESTLEKIIGDVLGEYGKQYEYKANHGLPELEYVVQYRESDFDFISRMIESYGVSYHHEFTESTQKVIFVDKDREDLPAGAERSLLAGAEQLRDVEALFEWRKGRSIATGKVKIKDNYFEKPTDELVADASASGVKYEQKDWEHYEQIYDQSIGKNIAKNYGEIHAKARLYAYQSQDNLYSGTGDSPGLAPGYLMQLNGHDYDDGKYVIVRSTHSLTVAGYRTGEERSSSYSGQYVFYPSNSDKPYTPPMKTPKPMVGGVETGVVSGGSEIDVDEYGRILVQFHWNRPDKKVDSIRIRVMQPWAGKSWGAVHWPRKGMEAVVSFVDGDPDRPIVIGTVYNKDNMPPYDLKSADNRNIAGFISKSIGSNGGLQGKYNEFVLDDTAGKELVRMHAQYDHETKIEHDERRVILNSRDTKITVDDTLTVDKNIMYEAKEQLTLKVGQSTIVMTPDKIEIKSVTINITATADLNTKGMATAKHDGGGMMTITAGMVKIN